MNFKKLGSKIVLALNPWLVILHLWDLIICGAVIFAVESRWWDLVMVLLLAGKRLKEVFLDD